MLERARGSSGRPEGARGGQGGLKVGKVGHREVRGELKDGEGSSLKVDGAWVVEWSLCESLRELMEGGLVDTSREDRKVDKHWCSS